MGEMTPVSQKAKAEELGFYRHGYDDCLKNLAEMLGDAY